MKTELEAYFKKFRLSPDMKRISRVILNNEHLDYYAWDFKINSGNRKEFMKICTFSIGQKGFYNEKIAFKEKRRTQLIKNIASILRIINLAERFSGVLKLIRAFHGDIVYGVKDGNIIVLKIYFVLAGDLNNNSTLINGLSALNIHRLRSLCRNRKGVMIALKFKQALGSFSIYTPFNDIKDIHFKGNNIAKKLFSELNIEKESFYYVKDSFSLDGSFLYSKVYKVYNDQRVARSIIKTRQEAGIFMGKDFRKMVNKNFKGCDFSVLGFNLQSGRKDVYIFPGQ